MEIALYIALGVLGLAVVAMQVWMARSQAPMAGDRSRLLRAVRAANAVLLIIAVAAIVYALAGR